MIEAIVPIPARLALGTMLNGEQVIQKCESNYQRPVISGRSIRVVPLTFYKVFSTWSGLRYEHIFATDEPTDPVSLFNYQDYNGAVVKDALGSILVPISVKQISTHSTSTYLFTCSINFLLKFYRANIPISTLPPVQPFPHDINSITISPFGEVHSYPEYQLHVFEPALNTLWAQWKLTDHQDLAIHTLTPELPSTVFDSVQEICSSINPDTMFSYIDDMAMYESNQHVSPEALINSFLYDTSQLDPITQWCITSPSYIMAKQLRPFLSNQDDMRKYLAMSYQPQDDLFTRNVVNLDCNAPWARELIEQICSLPDTHFTIKVTWDDIYPDIYSMFGYKSYLNHLSIRSYDQLYSCIRQLFLNKHVDANAYDDVIISKNWTDEVFISCNSKGNYVTYYINLAWYHLMSPSLVNHGFFTK